MLTSDDVSRDTDSQMKENEREREREGEKERKMEKVWKTNPLNF